MAPRRLCPRNVCTRERESVCVCVCVREKGDTDTGGSALFSGRKCQLVEPFPQAAIAIYPAEKNPTPISPRRPTYAPERPIE